MSSKKMVDADVKADQEERLSKKHIQTLSYVQELMKQNKKLTRLLEEYDEQKLHCDELHAQNAAAQEKIKSMQEQYLKRSDEVSDALVKKHTAEQLKLVEERLKAEQELQSRTKEMTAEIERLQKVNSSLEDALATKSQLSLNQLELNKENDELKERVLFLQKKVDGLTTSNKNQLSEIDRINSELASSKDYKDKLASSKQKVKELEGKVQMLTLELADSKAALADFQEREVKNFKDKLIKALNEVANLQGQIYQKDTVLESSNQKLRALLDELETVQEARLAVERERESLKLEISELQQQIARLRKAGRVDEQGNFREFVNLKRDVAVLQEENERLKERLSVNKVRAPSAKHANKQRITLKLN